MVCIYIMARTDQGLNWQKSGLKLFSHSFFYAGFSLLYLNRALLNLVFAIVERNLARMLQSWNQCRIIDLLAILQKNQSGTMF